jgi:nucleoside-diphosphate-sugar epimerase
VDDAVEATLLAAGKGHICSRVYNIGGDHPTTEVEVVQALNDLLGTDLQPVRTTADRVKELDTLLDGTRAALELNFVPGTDLYRGLSECVAASTRTRGPGLHGLRPSVCAGS